MEGGIVTWQQLTINALPGGLVMDKTMLSRGEVLRVISLFFFLDSAQLGVHESMEKVKAVLVSRTCKTLQIAVYENLQNNRFRYLVKLL
mmetsp:Transcript_3280/g.4712  ORF Transcript_3280/g.4712 Transcript_3280/m.4712 type:complete len:89 (+) Transcript_3280:3-269(+)